MMPFPGRRPTVRQSSRRGPRWPFGDRNLKLGGTVYLEEIKIELKRLPLDLVREVCVLVRERLDAVAADGC